jgi:hypothetical protein
MPCVAQTGQESHGACSPNVLSNPGTVSIICNVTQYTERGRTKALKLVAMELPRNNEDDNDTKAIIDFIDQLQKLDGQIVYLRLYTYPGAGMGLDNVPKNRRVRAGVVFDLGDLLDGFGGEPSDYKFGYSVQLRGYRQQWGMNIRSTILFPKSGNAFFDVHCMKSFSLDGLAKIRLSDIQGFQFIEIVPAQPFGDLLDKYEDTREKLPKGFHSEF